MPSSSSYYYYEWDSIVAIAVLAMLALMCLSLRDVRRRIIAELDHNNNNSRRTVSVPELADVACSLNAMRTHLYQIGRALDHHHDTTTTTTNDDGDARCEVCCRTIKKKGGVRPP